MKRIQWISRITYWILMVLFIVAPLSVVVFWVSNGKLSQYFDLHLQPPNFPPINELPLTAKFIGFLLSLLPTAFGMLILYCFARLFAHCEKGEILDIRNVFYIKIVAIAIFIWKIIRPFYDIALADVGSAYTHYPRALINFDITNLRGVIIATVLYVISWIMEEAYKMKQEQDLTI